MDKIVQIIKKFRDLYNKMAWFNSANVKNRFADYTSSEVHCVEYIGANADSNVTVLAESFYMTRGAISKMTKKLIAKGVIESYQKSDNKKEVYFKLTKQGQKIYDIHEEMHQEFIIRDKSVFEELTEEHFKNMFSFIETYSRHLDREIEKQGLDIKSE